MPVLRAMGRREAVGRTTRRGYRWRHRWRARRLRWCRRSCRWWWSCNHPLTDREENLTGVQRDPHGFGNALAVEFLDQIFFQTPTAEAAFLVQGGLRGR